VDAPSGKFGKSEISEPGEAKLPWPRQLRCRGLRKAVAFPKDPHVANDCEEAKQVAAVGRKMGLMEIEAKILDVNERALERTLLALGAKKNFDGTLAATIFNAPKGMVLRLRRETQGKSERLVLTVKKRVKRAVTKQMDEREIAVTDFYGTVRLLALLGYTIKKSATKHRTEYRRGNIHYCFDTYSGLPTFLEIEAPTEHAVLNAARELGFSQRDLKPWGGDRLFAYYGRGPRANAQPRR